MNENMIENTKNDNLELAHIIGINSLFNNCVQAHPTMTETITYSVGGIIVTEDLNEKNNQVFFRHGNNQISCFKLSNSGRFLAVGFTTSNLDKQYPANLIIWDFEKKEVLYELTGMFKAVKFIEFSHDDRFISALSIENSFFIWETNTGNRCYNRNYDTNTNMTKWVRIAYEENSKHPNYSIILSNVNNLFHYYFKYDLKSMQYVMEYNKFNMPSSGLSRTFVCSVYDYNIKILLVGTTGGDICLFTLDKNIYKGSFNVCFNGINNLLIQEDSSIILSGGDGKIKKMSLSNLSSNNFIDKKGKNTNENIFGINSNLSTNPSFSYILEKEIDLKKPVNSLTYSADNQEIIASNVGGEIFRVVIHNFSYTKHSECSYTPVNAICYGNLPDYFYSVDDYGNVIQWDLNEYNFRSIHRGNNKDKATSITIGDDANIFVGYSGGGISIFEHNLESKIYEFPAHKGKVNCIFVNCNYILSGGQDGVVRIWARTNYEMVMQFSAHHKEVHALFADFSYSNIIYSGGEDKNMNCFDLKQQKKVISHGMKNGFIFGMDQRKNNNKEVLSVGFNCGLCLWDFYKPDPVVELNLGRNFFCLKISNSGKYIALGSEFGELWILCIDSLKILSTMQGHSQRISSISWAPDDKQIITCCMDNSICIWNFYLSNE